MIDNNVIGKMVSNALREFWGIRNQSGVLNGQTMDGFAKMLQDLLLQLGGSDLKIIIGKAAKLPGYFRMSKDWDMVVIKNLPNGEIRLIAVIEFKSMHGSVGNNLNNRAEEAIGSSYDLWKAYEHGAFSISQPFLGYIYVMTDHSDNMKGTERSKMIFEPFEEFNKFPRTGKLANYEERLELLLARLVREKLYNSCALIIADSSDIGRYYSPNNEISIELLVRSLIGHVMAHQ